jgi:conjugal transfer pilus assembly protein TraW
MFLLSGILLSAFCSAKDCGVIGPSYPILEENFLVFIQKRLQALDFTALQQRWQAQVSNLRNRLPVHNLPRILTTRSWLFDPSIVLGHDLTTSTGILLLPKGSLINPLDTHRLSKALLFLNADDATQKQWAHEQNKALHGKTMLILVGGSVREAEQYFNKTVYFDTRGRIAAHFGLQHLPAIIQQEGLALRITEVKL